MRAHTQLLRLTVECFIIYHVFNILLWKYNAKVVRIFWQFNVISQTKQMKIVRSIQWAIFNLYTSPKQLAGTWPIWNRASIICSSHLCIIIPLLHRWLITFISLCSCAVISLISIHRVTPARWRGATCRRSQRTLTDHDLSMSVPIFANFVILSSGSRRS